LRLQDEIVSNHDELMCNFFAQADALAYGKSREELRSQNVPDYLIPHRCGNCACRFEPAFVFML
jgi:glucose-6-phosphate isomerase